MKTFTPLVSIVIPVYNGAKYVREAIDSALAQTYKNIEIIVVNDGSNDNGKTDSIIKAYGGKIRYFSKENGGVASALNLAIDNMRGEYFSWLSHDDVYLPNKIDYQINTLAKLDDKKTILYSGYQTINKKSKPIRIVDPASLLSKEQLHTPLIPLFQGQVHGCSLLIPSELFHTLGKFDENLRTTQDYRLWFDFFNVTKVHFCEVPLIQARQHLEQTTYTHKNCNEEANNLWIELLDLVSEEKMKETEGSCYAFMRRAELFLTLSSPYKKAANYATQKAKDYYGTSLISVIIPVYNRINLSIKAIKSVLDQTYTNLEIIVINDGSTEDVTLLEQLVSSSPKIRYFTQKNKGASAARNLGIEHALGDYIAFLDADDSFTKNKLALQLTKMIDDHCYISHTAYNRIDDNGDTIETVNADCLEGYVFNKILYSCPIATPTVLLRKSLLDNNRFIESLPVGEDICLFIDLLYQRKLSYLKQPCTNVLFNADTTAINPILSFKGYINIINHIVCTVPYDQYKEYLGHLITASAALLPTKESSTQQPELLRTTHSTWVKLSYYLPITYHFLRTFGVKKTVKKIVEKMHLLARGC